MTDKITKKPSNSEQSPSIETKSQNGHEIISSIPQKSPLVVRILPLIVLTTAFIWWGFTAKVPVKVVGQSIVLIPRSSVSFQSRSSGRISRLNVKVGDQIKKGQVLAIIEADEIREKLLTKQQELNEYVRENKEVTSIEQERSRVKLESIRSQKAAIPVQIAANQEQIDSNKKEQIAIAQQRKTYQQRIKQIDEIDQLISERYEAYNKLVKEGAVAPLDSSRIQAEDVLQKNLNEKTQLSAKLDDLNAKNIQLEAQNQSLVAQNQNLQAQLQSLISQESEIALNDSESDFKRQNTIDNLRRSIENVKVKLETSSQVISAYEGEITEISVNMGDYVQTGTVLGQIKVFTPENNQEVALAFFTPEDANRIREGMKIEVTPNLLTERRF